MKASPHPGVSKQLPIAPIRASASPSQIKADEQTINLAKLHQKRGQRSEAQRLCVEVLKRSPDNFEALYVAGTLALDVSDFELAAKFLAHSVLVNPKHAFAHLILAETFEKLHEPEAAMMHFRNVVKLQPDNVPGLCGMGRIHMRSGHADLALPLYEHAYRIDRDHKSVRVGLAEALNSLGRMDEAAQYLQDVIKKRRYVGWAWSNLVATRKYSGDPPELERIHEDLTDSTLTTDDKYRLHFAAGKILNDLGRYSEAIEQYKAGKAVKGHDFDVDTYRRWVDSMISLFSREMIEEHSGLGHPSEVPVFIVGMPRSGTTLTEQICASHPSVYGAGELDDMRRLARTVGSTNADLLNAMNAERLTALGDLQLSRLRKHSPDALRITDKMPHNFERLGFIALVFPNAKIIHCLRDPIDTCVSCYTTDFNVWHGYTSSMHKLGLYYREYDRLMKHWNSVLPGRIFDRRYEDMVMNQEKETRELIDHLGLPWDEACLRFFDQKRQVSTPSMLQVRSPVYNSSVKRWKNYGSSIQPLIDGLGDLADV
jgi:tetratricopeptide (TPR) repeat protein